MTQKRDRRLYFKEYFQRNRERILERRRTQWREYWQKHSETLLEKIRLKRWALKREVLTHYGNGSLTCVKCGFSDIKALSIDHIQGNGSKERKRVAPQGGKGFYRWLKKNGYPLGYQTLCMNCQYIKRIDNKEHFKEAQAGR